MLERGFMTREEYDASIEDLFGVDDSDDDGGEDGKRIVIQSSAGEQQMQQQKVEQKEEEEQGQHDQYHLEKEHGSRRNAGTFPEGILASVVMAKPSPPPRPAALAQASDVKASDAKTEEAMLGTDTPISSSRGCSSISSTGSRARDTQPKQSVKVVSLDLEDSFVSCNLAKSNLNLSHPPRHVYSDKELTDMLEHISTAEATEGKDVKVNMSLSASQAPAAPRSNPRKKKPAKHTRKKKIASNSKGSRKAKTPKTMMRKRPPAVRY